MCDLRSVATAQLYSSIASGKVPQVDKPLSFKLSFDGTIAGGKDLLSFGLIPLWDIRYVQSSASVFPVGLAWCSEKKASLTVAIPGLTNGVQDLEEHGFSLNGPDGFLRYNASIHIAADMASLWKLSGIGSAGNKHSCVYCNANNDEREYVGAEVTNLTVPSNWRTDLELIFGIPWKKVHICTLHAHTRTTEKLLKQVAVKSANKDMRQTKQRTKLEALVASCEDEVLRLKEVLADNTVTETDRRAHGIRLQTWLEKLQHNKTNLQRFKNQAALQPGVVAMEKAVISSGVLKKTWKITATENKKDSTKLSVDIPSLTGGQASWLLGKNKAACKAREKDGVDSRPYIDIIVAALGDCGHGDLRNIKEGDFRDHFCLQCNAAAIFYQYAEHIYPVLRATEVSQLDKLYENTPFKCWGKLSSLRGSKRAHEDGVTPTTGIDDYEKRAHFWGKLLSHTYVDGGNRHVIASYIHLIVDHSAVLCDIQGPLGFWSQQSYEASHKIVKKNYSRATSHGGGRVSANALEATGIPVYSSGHQMLVKHCRVFVGAIRLAISKASDFNWTPWLLAQFGQTNEEAEHAAMVRDHDVGRLKRILPEKMREGKRMRLQLEELNEHGFLVPPQVMPGDATTPTPCGTVCPVSSIAPTAQEIARRTAPTTSPDGMSYLELLRSSGGLTTNTTSAPVVTPTELNPEQLRKLEHEVFNFVYFSCTDSIKTFLTSVEIGLPAGSRRSSGGVDADSSW